MKMLFLTACILNFVWFVFVGWFIAKRLKQRIKAENEDFLKIIINYINSIRYGNITEKIDEKDLQGTNKVLAQSINRMSETLVDRENMIREYERVMLEKNKSLEAMVKKEQDNHVQRKDFIATLGHDLKVPILAADHTLDFLLDGTFGELNEKQYEALKKMKSSNSELIVLVENILATYKTEEQNLTLQKSLINLKTLIEGTLDDIETIAANEDVHINTELADMDIMIDGFQMKRVIKNLLYNALSYSAKNSTVDVKLESDGTYAIIKIIDYGIGIEPDDLPHIFEKYYSAAKKFRKVGTGLGLFLSKQIVEAHNGTICAESTPHERTEFLIKLPF